MISNIPAFAAHQDYQLRHADMLAAARGEGSGSITEIYCGRRVNWQPMPGPQTEFLNEPTTKYITYGGGYGSRSNSWFKRLWEDSKHQKGDKWITFHGWDLASKDETEQG